MWLLIGAMVVMVGVMVVWSHVDNALLWRVEEMPRLKEFEESESGVVAHENLVFHMYGTGSRIVALLSSRHYAHWLPRVVSFVSHHSDIVVAVAETPENSAHAKEYAQYAAENADAVIAEGLFVGVVEKMKVEDVAYIDPVAPLERLAQSHPLFAFAHDLYCIAQDAVPFNAPHYLFTAPRDLPPQFPHRYTTLRSDFVMDEVPLRVWNKSDE